MRNLTMKPVVYDAAQVARLVWFALRTEPKLPELVGLTRRRLLAIAVQNVQPSPKVLVFFEIQSQGEVFVWQPR